MRQNASRMVLILVICALSAVLVGLCIFAVAMHGRQTQSPTLSTQPSTTAPAAPTGTAPTVAEPTTQPTTVTTAPPETTQPTQPPQSEFVLTFVGDCTFANREGRTDSETFISTVGDNFTYPFADVYDIFAADDATFINLECVLSDTAKAPADKTFVFKGPTRYTNIMTSSSVEFANIVNNHTFDYGEDGYADTLAALDAAGLYYCEKKDTMVFTTAGGLKIGVYADLDPRKVDGIYVKMNELRKQGAEVIVAVMHWGIEYQYRANIDQVRIAHTLVDAGADIVYGHHPHVLQEIEYYNGGVIYYSLGNFSFGGNTSPADKDTAILQQTVIREPDGSIKLGDLNIIPCHVTGRVYPNDYQPCPMEPETEAYERVLKKLKGTYSSGSLYVPGRDDLNPTTTPTVGETTAPTLSDAQTDPPATETTAPTEPPATEATEPPATETTAPTEPPATEAPTETEAPSGGEE